MASLGGREKACVCTSDGVAFVSGAKTLSGAQRFRNAPESEKNALGRENGSERSRARKPRLRPENRDYGTKTTTTSQKRFRNALEAKKNTLESEMLSSVKPRPLVHVNLDVRTYRAIRLRGHVVLIDLLALCAQLWQNVLRPEARPDADKDSR
jgi:hypothetical protein